MCECISRWHNSMAPNLTSPHLKGLGAVTGDHALKHSANMNERSRGPDVCVCTSASEYMCVCTVFLVCQSSKYMQLLKPYWEQQSRSGPHHANLRNSHILNWLCN